MVRLDVRETVFVEHGVFEPHLVAHESSRLLGVKKFVMVTVASLFSTFGFTIPSTIFDAMTFAQAMVTGSFPFDQDVPRRNRLHPELRTIVERVRSAATNADR